MVAITKTMSDGDQTSGTGAFTGNFVASVTNPSPSKVILEYTPTGQSEYIKVATFTTANVINIEVIDGGTWRFRVPDWIDGTPTNIVCKADDGT